MLETEKCIVSYFVIRAFLAIGDYLGHVGKFNLQLEELGDFGLEVLQ